MPAGNIILLEHGFAQIRRLDPATHTSVVISPLDDPDGVQMKFGEYGHGWAWLDVDTTGAAGAAAAMSAAAVAAAARYNLCPKVQLCMCPATAVHWTFAVYASSNCCALDGVRQ
jgi:hypothetical protein